MSSTESVERNSRFEFTPLSFDVKETRINEFEWNHDQEKRASGDYRGMEKLYAGMRSARPSRKGGKEGKERNINSFFLFIIITLSCILILELVFHFVLAPHMRVTHIDIKIDSTLELSNSHILEIGGLESGAYYYSVDTDKVKNNLEAYPAVRSAEVNKTFPDKLQIKLEGRVPMAIAMVETEEATIPVAFDREGIVFQVGPSITDWNLPIISGIKFTEIQLGMKLPERLLIFLDDLENISNGSPALMNVISEFHLVRKNNLDFEVIVYPRDYQIPVRIGSSIDEHLIKYILMVLDVVERENYSDTIKELDFRTDEIVYRFKEG